MQPPTVFVVDDDDGSRRSVEALAASMGLAALAYASAEEFLDAYDGRPGCVVTDLRMLGMSGLDLQEKLKQMQYNIPVILMTAFGDVPIAVRAMEQGAITVLEKPCFDTQLCDAISKALEVDRQRRERGVSQQEMQQRLGDLTDHEREVLQLIIDGIPNKTIAKRLDVSIRTVENRRQSIFRKLGANSVAGLVQAVLLAEGKIHDPNRGHE